MKKRMISFAFFLVMVLVLFLILRYPLPGFIILGSIIALAMFMLRSKGKKQGAGPEESKGPNKDQE